MRIWIDLGNSPHVPFFRALAPEFERRGHEVLWTARDYAQTVELARNAGLPIEVFGSHGGKSLLQKGLKYASRVGRLTRWARGRGIGLALSHNSHEPLAVARLLGIESVNLMDYEHHPANRLSFRLASRVVVPESFPDEILGQLGAMSKTRKFQGIKEDVYLAGFRADPGFRTNLDRLGIAPENVLVVVRTHAPEALYHRGIANDLFDVLLDRFAADPNVRIIVLPRKSYQGDEIRAAHPQTNIIFPEYVLDGANLLAAADLVVSGGGTMNREAAALGVPTATVFAGKGAAVDDYLFREGRLLRIESAADLARIEMRKKSGLNVRVTSGVREEVVKFILNES
jgi:predicted glycosyltransferase